MSSLWISALLDPSALALSRIPAPSLARALALLVDGQFADYQRQAEEEDWPRIGTSPTNAAGADGRLVASFALQLTGGNSTEELVAMSGDQLASEDLRLVALILACIRLRDSGQFEAAIRLLSELSLDQPTNDAFRLIHLSITHMEAGDPTSALAAAAKARGQASRAGRTPVGRALTGISARNRSAFAASAGRWDMVQHRVARAAPVDGSRLRAMEGLSSFVDQEFDGRLRDPGVSSFAFRQEDPVQAPLVGAMLRAEVAGDWYLLRHARQELGKYQLLASVGQEGREPVSAFHLLRRAGDSKSLRKAIRSYKYEGQLAPIREYGEAVAQIPWTPFTWQSDLVSLAECADLMTTEAAEVALQRLLASMDRLLSGLPTARLESETIQAIAGLLPPASDGAHNAVASVLLTLISQSTDPLLLQSVSPALESIRWTSVADSICAQWQEFCIRYLAGSDDRRFAALTLVGLLPNSEGMRDGILASFERRPDLLSAAAVVEITDPPARIRVQTVGMLRARLKDIRLAAARGEHGFGELIDAGLLLLHLTRVHPTKEAWSDIVGFVTDGHVAASKRMGILDVLLQNPTDLPTQALQRLTAWASGPIQYPSLPMEEPSQVSGTVLRARAVLKVRPEDQLLSEVLLLASSPSPTARHQAALTILRVPEHFPIMPILVLALTLSKDSAFEVRGTAGRALIRLAPQVEDPIRSIAWDRVIDLLNDRGSVVPQWVLGGIQPGMVPDRVAQAIRTLSTSLSWGVRQGAREALSKGTAERVRTGPHSKR